jgi:hypothetical protein
MKIKIKPIKININLKEIQRIYPDLEDLEITPTTEEQNFKSELYGYNDVKVHAIESEELNIVPSNENQVKEGMFNKVTVTGDNNLSPDNIKKGATIFNIEGQFEGLNTSDATATEKDLLQGKTAYNSTGKIEGTIPNNGDLNIVPEEKNSIIKPEGYYSNIKIKPVNETDFYTNYKNTTIDILRGENLVSEDFEQLKYIESTGEQYIKLTDWYDTKLSTSNFYDIVADVQFTVLPSEYDNKWHLNGVASYTGTTFINKYDTLLYFGYNYYDPSLTDSTPKFCYSPSLKNTDCVTDRPIDTERHIFKVISNANKPEAGFWIDNEHVGTEGSTLSTKKFGYPFYIFGYENSSGVIGNKQRVYRFQILNNDSSLFYDLIPARRKSDNAIGLYDTVRKIFYTNNGTSEFLYEAFKSDLKENLEEILNERNNKVISENIKSGINLFNVNGNLIDIKEGTADATATSENIEEGQIAYVNGKKVIGTLENYGGHLDAMVSDANLSVGNQRGWDCVSVKYVNNGKKIYDDGWCADQHIKYEQLAKNLNVSSEQIKVGQSILGIEGVSPYGTAYEFFSEEEAKAFTNYKVGDLALIKSFDFRPIYPSRIKYAGPSARTTRTAYGSNVNSISKISIKPNMTITLDAPVTTNLSKIVEGEKNNAEVSISINATECVIKIYDGATLSSTYYAKYTSQDGLTYTNISPNNWFVKSDGTDLSEFCFTDYSEDVWVEVKNDWENMNLLSFFLQEGRIYHVNNILQYAPTSISVSLTENNKYYTYDLESLKYDEVNNLPYATLIRDGINLTPYVEFATNNNIFVLGDGNKTIHGILLLKNGNVGYFTDLGVVFDGTGNGYVYSYMDNEYYDGKGYIGNIENNTLTTYDKTNYPTVKFTYPESSSSSPSPMRKICDLSEAKAIFTFNGSGTSTNMSYINAQMPLIACVPNSSASTISLDVNALCRNNVWCNPSLVPLNNDFI